MSANYGEIICKAVDEIVTAKLQGLSYDITKLCTVVDSGMSYQGKYVVSDGTARYEAYSTDKGFRNGNQVLVQVPNGDYTMQKTIIGRVATTDSTPFNYTSPLDTIIKITNNVFDDARTIYGDNAGLLANGEKRLLGPIYSLEGNSELNGYTRLGLSANFRSWLTGLDVASGTYGIKILIYTDMVREAGATATNTVYELTFSSADMIGNPYQFEDYFYQEKVFDISTITNIQKLEVYFYQDSNFLDGNGNQVPYYDTDVLLGATNKPNNLFVNDVRLYMGYEQGYFTDETLVLHTPGSTTYRYDKVEAKEVNLRWIHKIDETNYEVLTSKNFDTDKYEIHWFKYEPGYKEIDQYAGKDWKEVQTGDFTYFLAPEVKNQTERIKVIGLIKSISTEEIETATPYFSNILIFNNEELVPDQTTLKASTALSIRCLDGSEGNYLLYDQNGKLINEGAGKGYSRHFKAMYQGGEITEDLGTVNWIKWYLPAGSETMIISTDDMYKENNGAKTAEEYHYRGTNYIEITREKKDNKIPVVEQTYAIENYWNAQKSNNTIMCRVSINGVEYEALEELHFGKAGSNGTTTTFLIEFTGNDNALTLGSDESVEVRARLYWGNEEKANGFPENQEVNWSWFKGKGEDENQSKIGQYATITESNNKSYITLKLNEGVDTLPTNNYMILKASTKINDTTLEAYLPIPIKTADALYMEGAREVIYNHQGNPSYYDGAYVAFYREGEENQQDKDWKLTYNESLPEGESLSKSYLPRLVDMTSRMGYKALQASSFYAQGYNDEVCVSCAHWSQPLLIMQSKYDLAMLNSWDGSLTLDDENGTILSTMLGAGKKDSNNAFSGVLIGDVKEGTDNNETESLTGVYGLSEGVISYALKEDGTAIFGKKGRGQIKIDGDKSTIKSGDYDNGYGMLIDLDDGKIDIKGKSNDISSSGFLINIDGSDLINISKDKYYLKSYGYTESVGALFDLKSGELSIKGTGGSISLNSNDDSPLLKIDYLGEIGRKSSLMEIGENNYYLQSKDYKIADSIPVYDNINSKKEIGKLYYMANLNVNSDNHQVEKEGTLVDKVVINNNNIYKVVENNKEYYRGDLIQFDAIVSTNVGTDGETSSTTLLSAEDNKKRFLGSAVLQYTEETKQNKGFRLDLKDNLIEGYNLCLTGIKQSDPNKRIIIDSSAPTYPLRIGSNFMVDWDGNMTCSNPIMSGNGSISFYNDYHISSNGAGGGTWQGESTGVRGFKDTKVSLADDKTRIILAAKISQGI